MSRNERLRRWSAWRFDEEVEIRFLDRKDDLDRVVYSLLRVSDRALAEELYLRVREEGASFRSLAEQFSEGPETETGGLIGPIAMTTAHPELAKRLRVGREGQIWPTFAIGDVWLVVRLKMRVSERTRWMNQGIKDMNHRQGRQGASLRARR